MVTVVTSALTKSQECVEPGFVERCDARLEPFELHRITFGAHDLVANMCQARRNYRIYITTPDDGDALAQQLNPLCDVFQSRFRLRSNGAQEHVPQVGSPLLPYGALGIS